jgi:hypothetical protein
VTTPLKKSLRDVIEKHISQSRPLVFVECLDAPDLTETERDILRDFGPEGWMHIQSIRDQKVIEDDYWAWQVKKSLRDDPEIEDEEVDFGPEEDDEYGE